MTRWAALIAVLLAASPAGAQCLGFQCPPGVLGAGASGAPLPLDGFTQPAAAYSFRKLRSAYAGPAVKLRRTTGGTQDINFLGCTGFTGCPIDTAAASTFCAATTCFVDTWYDQSGLARDVVQATTANQPQFIFNCTGTLPCLETTALAQTLATAGTQTPVMPVTFAAVGNRVTGTDGCAMGAQAPGNYWGPWYIALGNWELAAAFVAPAADNTWHSGSAIMNGAASVLRIDATETTGTATGGTAAGIYTAIRGGAATTCRMTENIRWDAYALPPAERVALQTNQKSFWGTP